MSANLQSIVHPTDFSDLSADAFVHALRIALAAKTTLYLLHVETNHESKRWSLPHGRYRHASGSRAGKVQFIDAVVHW